MGISRIRSYEYRGIPINRNYDVFGKQVYIGNGQNCGTFWFNSVEEAKRLVDAYYEEIKVDRKGLGLIPEEICERCQCHYPSSSKEYRKYEPFACRAFKETLINEALDEQEVQK